MTSARRSRRLGLTAVELLIAGLVLVVVLGAASAFFAQQVRLQRDVQARNELQDRVRVATQLITQDLALVGNPVLIDADGRLDEALNFPGCNFGVDPLVSCLEIVDVSPTQSTLRLRYVSSQFATAAACRDVGYRVQGSVLQRRDVPCGSGDGSDGWVDLAPQTLGFKVVLVCSDGVRHASFPLAACGGGVSYGRSALFSVAAESTRSSRPDGPATRLVTTNPATFFPVACPAGSICFDATAEVLMPNLKDR